MSAGARWIARQRGDADVRHSEEPWAEIPVEHLAVFEALATGKLEGAQFKGCGRSLHWLENNGFVAPRSTSLTVKGVRAAIKFGFVSAGTRHGEEEPSYGP